MVSPTKDSFHSSNRDWSSPGGQVWLSNQHSPSPVRHKRVRYIHNGLERTKELGSSPNIPHRGGGGQDCGVGGTRPLGLPISPEEPGGGSHPILSQDQLGLKALQSSFQDMEVSTVTGGGLFDGGISTHKLESEIASRIDSLARTIEFKACSPGTQDRRLRLLTKFFQWCIKEAKTIKIEDTIVLYCYRHLGSKSGEQINREASVILLCLKLLGTEIDSSAKKRIAEVIKYCNLVYPPEGCNADPVTLGTIFELMDKADEHGVTFVRGRALDILLIAYATMSRLGEIAQLQPDDVKVDDKGTVRISVITKTSRRGGLRVEKLVPKAVQDKSWCPCQILLEWVKRAKEGRLHFVFANNFDVKPTVTSIDKALEATVIGFYIQT